MTDLLVDMSQHLIDANICTAIGNDVFQNFLPPNPDEIVVLTEYAGLPQVLYTDTGVRSVQVKVRSTSSEQARVKAWNIYNIFFNSENPVITLTTSNRPVLCKPRQQPTRVETDSEGRIIWGFNMGVTTYNEI